MGRDLQTTSDLDHKLTQNALSHDNVPLIDKMKLEDFGLIRRGNTGSEIEIKDINKRLGLPGLDLSGFDQEAPYKGDGSLKDAWHSLKHLFVKDESLHDKIHEKIESKMTPEERKRYEKENKELEDYNNRVRAWETQMSLIPGPRPARPETPMHGLIDQRTSEAEKQIAKTVLSHMSPEDRARLDKQNTEYSKQLEEYYKPGNPWGTGDGFRRPPTPGNAIKDYQDRIKEETEKYLSH